MKHVLVIGAGVAGLAAATTLAEAGRRVTVLEAGDRVGGRIRTMDAGGIPVELGAEFVHGRPPELLALIDELRLGKYQLGGETIVHAHEGILPAESDDVAGDGGSPFAVMEQMAAWSDAHPEQDMSFAAWLAQEHIPEDRGARATAYVEGFNAADADEASIRALAVQQDAEDSIEGDTSFHVSGGYQRLPEALLQRLLRAGGMLRLQSAVQRVAWQRGRVRVTLRSAESVEADAAVITLPLGVLQAGTVSFEPQPDAILHHAQRMRMGRVCRMTIVFKRRWWAEIVHPQHERLQSMSFLIPAQGVGGAHFNVFWTPFPSLDPVLTAWSGGPSSAQFDLLDDHAVAHIVCGDLARVFGLTREAVLQEMVSHHRHDWQRDPLSLGAYAWVPAGAVDASGRMTQPVEDTLFFAGEHTDTTGHWGTVHGALRSGLRAAAQIGLSFHKQD